ncbi:hypothetical protein QJQ45_024891, partial [Haematococcus lacustris]
VDKHANYQRLFALTAGQLALAGGGGSAGGGQGGAGGASRAAGPGQGPAGCGGRLQPGRGGAGDRDCCLQLPPGKGLRHVQVQGRGAVMPGGSASRVLWPPDATDDDDLYGRRPGLGLGLGLGLGDTTLGRWAEPGQSAAAAAGLCWLLQVTRNAEEENCAVEVYFQVGPSGDPVQRALLDLADQVLGEPAYNTLRTQEQLGYTVQLGARLTHGVLGLCGLIVSASHPPQHLELRLDAFLTAFYTKLQGLSDEELRAAQGGPHRQQAAEGPQPGGGGWQALGRNLEHAPCTAPVTLPWPCSLPSCPSALSYEFFAREAEVAALTSVTRDMLCAWYVDHLLPGSPTRRKLAVHILPAKDCPASGVAAAHPALGTNSADAVNIPDLAAFKATCDRLSVRRGTLPPLAA